MLFLTLVLIAFTQICIAVNPWEPEAKDGTWLTHHEMLLNNTRDHKADIKVIFLGDSITGFWSQNGKTVWAAHYANRGAYNYGIGGDTTSNVLWRVQNKEFDGLTPKFVVLLVGTNNIKGTSAEDVAHGIKTIIDNLFLKMASTKVLLLGITPRIPADLETKVQSCNTIISKYADNSKIYYLDMSSHFQDSPGVEKEGLFVDGAHLTEAGYQVWYETMEPTFAKLYAM